MKFGKLCVLGELNIGFTVSAALLELLCLWRVGL